MKVCLSCHQSQDYLEKAHEISFTYTERNKIVDMAEKYPGTDMILVHTFANSEIDWNEILDIYYLTNNRLILALDSIDDCREAAANNIKFFYNKRVYTFLELNAIKKLGSCYIIPGEPLFFQMDAVKKRGVPIRIIPNLVFLDENLYKDGVLGSWIRPEDMFAYKSYIDAIEFFSADAENPLTKERALYRVYMEDEEWPDELHLLITGLRYPGNSLFIESKSSLMRLNCAQLCQHRSPCRICYQILDLANPDRIKKYLDDAHNSYYFDTEVEEDDDELEDEED